MYVPAFVKVKLNEFPGERLPESQAPWLAVTVCVTLSLFVQVTLVPTETFNVAGLKEKLWMLTLGALPLGDVAVGVGVEALVVGVLVAGFVVAVGVVDPLVVLLLPQAARKASRVSIIRQNPAVLKEMNVFFCIGLSLLEYVYDTQVLVERLCCHHITSCLKLIVAPY